MEGDDRIRLSPSRAGFLMSYRLSRALQEIRRDLTPNRSLADRSKMDGVVVSLAGSEMLFAATWRQG
jgi:hypothetical protein